MNEDSDNRRARALGHLASKGAALCLLLLATGCEQSFFMVGDKGREATIERLSAARDACLAKQAAAADSTADAAIVARDVASACRDETDRLAATVNRDGDPKVTDAIRQRSEFRAMGYVLRARGIKIH
ncbi:MAG: hypothetical protein U1E21_21045 [Reyranellaceae bacterium]